MNMNNTTNISMSEYFDLTFKKLFQLTTTIIINKIVELTRLDNKRTIVHDFLNELIQIAHPPIHKLILQIANTLFTRN